MDRFQAGAIAGVVGTLPTFFINWLLTATKIAPVGFSTLAGHLLTQGMHHDFAYYALGALGDISVGAGLGLLYAYLSPERPPLRWLRGILFGGAVWFLTFAAAELLRIAPLHHLKASAELAFIVTDLAYGLTVAYVLPLIGERFFVEGK